MTWTAEMLKISDEQQLILLRQLLAEISSGAIFNRLRAAIRAHDVLLATLHRNPTRKEEAVSRRHKLN